MNKSTLIFCCFTAVAASLVTSIFLERLHFDTFLGASQNARRSTPVHLAHTKIDNAAYLKGFTPEEQLNIQVYDQTSRSVVYINTESRREFFFREAVAQGEGSGSILDKDGHILTNFHVVNGANAVQVTLFNGNSYSATLVGADVANDCAILKINAPEDELFPVCFGDSSRLKVGQKVYAIGNPFGLELTLSTGIVSSLNRSLPSQARFRMIRQVIQIDASINPGNSGGPLLDSHGEVIGMNVAIASRSGDSAGVGFAIPANTLTRIIPQLIQHGKVLRPNLGIEQVTHTDSGLLITRLQPGGPAEKAGLSSPKVVTKKRQQGPYVYEYQTLDRATADFIVGINGQDVKTVDDLLTIIETLSPGDTVQLVIMRNKKTFNVPIILGESE
ncbi:MAG: trypsin-like peptidase domain-containing protein [Planctomycetia bacterium]|nr:trypsin-like peptidase domain-containing protein [Planctomycetia bacterium]